MGDAASKIRTVSVNLVDGGVVAHAHEEHGSLNDGRIACTGSMPRNVQEPYSPQLLTTGLARKRLFFSAAATRTRHIAPHCRRDEL